MEPRGHQVVGAVSGDLGESTFVLIQIIASYFGQMRMRARNSKAFSWQYQGKRRGSANHLGQSLDLSAQWAHFESMTMPTPFPGQKNPHDKVTFDRHELGAIMGLYGKMVAAGEWRDYGMSFLKDVAVFSVFRRTAENPMYRIEKRPSLRNRQGMYCIIAMDGHILRRGHDLRKVLRVLERKLIRSVEQ